MTVNSKQSSHDLTGPDSALPVLGACFAQLVAGLALPNGADRHDKLIGNIEEFFDDLSELMRRGANKRRAWRLGVDGVLAHMADTGEYVPARVVPPLPVASLPLRGVQHAVLTRPDVFKVVIHADGRAPVLLVPGTAHDAPGRLAAWLETQILSDMRRYTDCFCRQLGLSRVHIDIIDHRRYWGLCYGSGGRIFYNWRLILAPPFVARYVAAHEVSHLLQPGHGRGFWALTKRLAPDVDDAEAWLDANGDAAFGVGTP